MADDTTDPLAALRTEFAKYAQCGEAEVQTKPLDFACEHWHMTPAGSRAT